MMVFRAMLIDAYRELNSKRLFWVVLGLSAIVVVFYGSIGFDEAGMSMLYGLTHVESEFLTKDSLMSVILYRSIFSTFIVGLWLTFVATILALIATTTIFPDFVAGGSIDLALSKPIRRVSLFAIKYVASLLFMLLQVTIFCVGIFLCMGLRLDDWEWKIFLAIPLVTLFYSYLFSVNVLFGVWTRSALAALLITMLLWFSLFGINMAEGFMNQERTKMVIAVEKAEGSITQMEAALERSSSDEDAGARARLEARLERSREERDETQVVVEKLDNWFKPIRKMQTVLPKTSETTDLLDRALRRDMDVNLMDIMSGNVESDDSGGFITRDTSEGREVFRRMEEEYLGRSPWYIIGSSLGFEAVILALACWIFVRRDY